MANEVVLFFLGLSLNYDVNGNIAKGISDQKVEYFHPSNC